MKQHYSEADLLETYYTQPGASMPVMMHLAGCSDCAARYERLDAKLRGTATCHSDKPETFWARQRISVMRKIDAQRSRSGAVARVTRIAAAAAFALVVGGVVTLRQHQEVPLTTTYATATHAPATASPNDNAVTTVPTDPWKSEELEDFHSMVAWESWTENGDRS
jgi:hypothetical protein